MFWTTDRAFQPMIGRTFDRFWRGREVRTNGAGLGLAIVMEIAKAHGASIAVSGRSRQGARFDLQFRPA